ncbi:MAG: hypothetical protein EPO68_15210, partial [Planctomycetota bacterium]
MRAAVDGRAAVVHPHDSGLERTELFLLLRQRVVDLEAHALDRDHSRVTVPGETTAPSVRFVRELGRGATARVDLVVAERAFTSAAGAPVRAGTELARKRLLAAPAAALRGAARALAPELHAEAIAARAARHPSLVDVIAEGSDEHGPFLLLNYVPGLTLHELSQREGPQPEPLVRSLGSQLAEALAALHGAGFAHGDVKPENVRVGPDGRAVLLDLGFAFRASTGGNTQRPGSLPYLSPERAQGGAPSSPADVWALAIVLYELATGVHPFDERARARFAREPGLAALLGRSTGELLRRSLEAPGADELLASIALARYEPPSRLVPQLSPFLDRVLREALARDPARRPTAAALARWLAEGERGSWWTARRAETGDEADGARAAESHLTPLVGRAEPLRRLRDAYAAVASPAASGGALVWLCGEDGSGKSRLVSALAESARELEPAPLYLYARCSELDVGRPAGALLALLSRWLRMADDARPGEREAALLARVVPPREARTLVQALDPALADHASGAVHVALAEWLDAISQQQPLILFLDDLHSAGATTVEALERVLEHLPRMRALLVLGLRETAEWHERPHLARLRARLADPPERIVPLVLRLEPLQLADVLEFARRVFHHSVPRLKLAQVLMQRSHGNPGLLAEILRGLLARGQATAEPGAARQLLLHIPPERIREPQSIAGSVQQRYRELSAADRLWLGRLSVVGGRIDAEFLARAFGPAEHGEVEQILARLARGGWLTASGARYRFARPALREAIYRTLPADRQRRMHAAAARAL